MAEAFLKVIVANLSSLVREGIGLMMGVDDEMQKLSSTLTTIQAVLEDAELKQIESKPICDWLRKLNYLAYEIDDILDDCATHVSKLKHARTKKSRFSLMENLHRYKIGKRLKHVLEKLNGVAAERSSYHLRELAHLERPRSEGVATRETGSLLNEPDQILSRDEDREKIVRMLVDEHVLLENQKISVLPIIGVGGLGKTTLAQLVFNDPRVVDHFEKRLWVCVSDNFEIKTLVKAMIESATGTGKASDLQHLDALERCLWELLRQKRYLLVLDDVWSDNQEKWFELRDILSCGSTGSSIIVTTRQQKVADIMGTLPAHSLKGLSDEHCWVLLRHRAFGQDEEVHSNLEVIGKQIVKKCAGVPLAAKALGGILRFKRREEEWIEVKESEMWKLSQQDTLILPTLRLSYHHLPLELRQCFSYFATFPKDYEIRRNELVFLWMAHGYILPKGTLEAEDVGNGICDELVIRSLLQSARFDCISMHDLVHDLAQSVMETKVPWLQSEGNITSASTSTIRQVSLRDNYVVFPKRHHQNIDISSIMKLKSLRVIDAGHLGLNYLPRAISNLKHLRYLNMENSRIHTLPSSLCSLWNLKILNLNGCYLLVALPKNMRYLKNLRHLCLKGCSSLSEMPPRIRELSCLKTLSLFVVGLNKGNQLEELKCLNLGGSLEIRHLERVEDNMDANKANIAEKKNLRELTLSWERTNNSPMLGEDIDEKVLEALQPHTNLESLCISGFMGRFFPLWMTNSIIGKVVDINILYCPNCRHLPKLGELPHLKKLWVEGVAVEYIIEDENLGKIQFPALESLNLCCLQNLKGFSKEQESKKAFPNLIKLHIFECSSLLSLPPLSSSMQRLESLICSNSTLSLFSELDTLTHLTVEIDKGLTCFSMETLLKFSNLQSFTIRQASEISLAGEGLQALKRLNHIGMENCRRMQYLPEGLLRHLTDLKSLSIQSCPEIVELPEEIKHLQNLERIELNYLPKMACLPEAMQQLSSLVRLDLISLPELESLPDWLHQLTSLDALDIYDCAKLVSLPSLPNLRTLCIMRCPELERQCERGEGEWQKIAHIPRLNIGY